MQRSRRRLWTWTVTAVASSLVLAALVVGVFRLAVLAAPSYKQNIEDWVAAVMNRPVDIGDMDLTWRGLRPTLQFFDVALQGVSPVTPALEVAELELGFSLRDLVQGRIMPVAINVVGAVVEVVRDADGAVRVRGISVGQGGESVAVSQQLAGLGHVQMSDASLLWHDQHRDRPPMWFRQVDLDIDRIGTDLDIELSGVSQLGGGRLKASMRLSQTADGKLLGVGGRARIDGLEPGRWMDAWLPLPLGLTGDTLELESQFSWTSQGEATLDGRVRSGRLRQLDGPGALDGVEADFAATLDGKQQRVVVRDLGVRNSDGSDWAADRVVLEQRASESRRWLAVQASRVQLRSLLPWLSGVDASGALPRVTGEVEDLLSEIEWTADQPDTPPAVSLTARLHRVGLLAQDQQPAVSGLSGVLSLTQDGGTLELDSDNVAIELPATLEQPVQLDQLTSSVHWRREGSAWRIRLTDLAAAGHAARANGSVEVVLGEQAPQLDVELALASEDATALKPLVPRQWHPNLRAWLDQAVVDGRVGSGRLRIAGAVDQFPFRNGDGSFRLELNINPGTLSIGKGWPTIDDAVAQLIIDGESLSVEAVSGRMLGVALTPATVIIEDFREPVLDVDGGANGSVDRMLSFLSASPLSSRVGYLDKLLDPRGFGHLDLSLDIPLKNINATRFAGTVTLTGIELQSQQMPEPFRDVQGSISFSNDGLGSTGLKGVFREAPVRVTLSTERLDVRQVTRLALESPVRFDTDNDPWARMLPDAMRARLDGHATLSAELALDRQMPRSLSVRSDLVNVVSTLPAPLNKEDASAALPLRVEFPIHNEWPRLTRVEVGDRMVADVRSEQDNLFAAAGLGFGGGGRPGVPDAGVVVTGTAPVVDVLDWSTWLGELATQGGGGESSSVRIDLTAGRLSAGPLRLGQQSIRGQFGPQGGDFKLVGAAEGQLAFDGAGRGRWYARLDHLYTERLAKMQATATDREPMQLPQSWPEIDIEIAHLQVADLNAGRLVMKAVPRPSGISLDTLRLQGGEVDLELGGYAARPDDVTRAGLTGVLETARIDKVMFAAGFVPNVRAESARIALNIGWPDSPEGLHLETATGALDISFRDGALAAVDPGAGRVLGLFSFYALPRRLLLDFRDMTETGLTFDGIDGHFRVSGGQAQTEDFTVSAPSLSIDVEGAVGLSDRSYDQVITVSPDVSSGVTLAGALFGGPAMGAILMIAQELLDRPLNQATQLSYHLGGTWDDPVITRRGVEPTPAPAADKGPRS